MNRCTLIVLTGGPGAGKTAIMEVAKQMFCQHVMVLPEAASIVYSGGFPRKNTAPHIRSAQRVIFQVQKELEQIAIEEGTTNLVLCDRGLLDGAAYWPWGESSFFETMSLSKKEIFARYNTVIHLRTPSAKDGYNYSNAMRIESPEEACILDNKIELLWQEHPNRHIVPATENFTDKIAIVTNLIKKQMNNCCAHMEEILEQPETSSFPSCITNEHAYLQ